MLWELCGVELGMQGRLDVTCAQLVEGIAPLQVGQQAKTCQNVLFCNPGEKTMTILAGDVIGCAKLAGQGMINPDWHRAMESLNLVHSVGTEQRAEREHPTERTHQLIKQLGLMNNRLLSQHPEVRSKLINIVTRYEAVFTDSDVAVGKTDVLKIKIVLDSGVTPVRAAV